MKILEPSGLYFVRMLYSQMTPFQQDITKIILDKGLLAIVVAIAGFYLNRVLERFRARYAYAQTLSEAKLHAYRDLGDAILQFSVETLNFSRMLQPGRWPSQGKPGFEEELNRQIESVKRKRENAFKVISSNLIFLGPDLHGELISYLQSASKLLKEAPRKPEQLASFETRADEFDLKTSELQKKLSMELHKNPF